MRPDDIGFLASFALGIAGYFVGVRLIHAHRMIWALAWLFLFAIVQVGMIAWQMKLDSQLIATASGDFLLWLRADIIILAIGALVAAGVAHEWHRLGPKRLTIAVVIGLAVTYMYFFMVVARLPISFRAWLPSSASDPFDGAWRATIGVPLVLLTFGVAATTRSFVGTAIGVSAPLILLPVISCTVGCDWVAITVYPIIPFVIVAAWLGSKVRRVFLRGST